MDKVRLAEIRKVLDLSDEREPGGGGDDGQGHVEILEVQAPISVREAKEIIVALDAANKRAEEADKERNEAREKMEDQRKDLISLRQSHELLHNAHESTPAERDRMKAEVSRLGAEYIRIRDEKWGKIVEAERERDKLRDEMREIADMCRSINAYPGKTLEMILHKIEGITGMEVR